MNREERIAQLVADYRARGSAGEFVSPSDLIEQHPDLMPELGEALSSLDTFLGGQRPAFTDPIPCPSPGEIQDWLRGRAGSLVGTRIDHHLDDCANCRR